MPKTELKKALVLLRAPRAAIFEDDDRPSAALRSLVQRFQAEYALADLVLHDGNPTSLVVPSFLLPSLYASLQNDRACKHIEFSAYTLDGRDN
jgi:hypothetical protein